LWGKCSDQNVTHHDGPGDNVFVLRVRLDPVVEGDGMQDVQQLTLVFVDALDLQRLSCLITILRQISIFQKVNLPKMIDFLKVGHCPNIASYNSYQ
jgi:hypothetical protein